jgi:hypothetical protein
MKEYWVNKSYLYVFGLVFTCLSFLIVYLFTLDIKIVSVSFYWVGAIMIIAWFYMGYILIGLLNHPHIKLTEDKKITRPSVLFKDKTLDLDREYEFHESQNGLMVFEGGSAKIGRKTISVIRVALSQNDYLSIAKTIADNPKGLRV